jgi:hypothetical protein
MRIPTWLTTAAHPLYRERISRAYLVVVAASVLLFLLDTAVYSGTRSSITGTWLLIATLPWTPLLWLLFVTVGGMNTEVTAYGWSGWTLTLVAALVAAVVNAALLGCAARLARRRVPAR